PRMRFEREIEILSQLRHPNIVTVHDSGVAGGRLYYVMDFIQGQPVDRLVRGMRGSSDGGGGRARPAAAVGLCSGSCDALKAAHLLGVIHRDLKPGNILIDGAGEPHLLDFGLAKFTIGLPDDPSHLPSMTEPGHFVGSLPWASPEQVSG